MSNNLYHYTEYVAFDGIINKGIIRLNNILNMNDASEMRFFIDSISKVIYKKLKSFGKEQNAERIITFINNEVQEEFYYSAYAACFSKYRDDAAQWDRYGRSGQGVCIGFDEETLKSLMGGSLSLQDVLYKEDVSDHPLVNQLVEIASDELFDLNHVQSVMEDIWIQSSAFKHPSFASEKEVRLVVSPFISDEFAVEPQYNISQNRIKKYYPLDIKELCHRNNIELCNLVTEIIIGPTSTQSVAILADYLNDCKAKELSSRIKISECPLRISL